MQQLDACDQGAGSEKPNKETSTTTYSKVSGAGRCGHKPPPPARGVLMLITAVLRMRGSACPPSTLHLPHLPPRLGAWALGCEREWVWGGRATSLITPQDSGRGMEDRQRDQPRPFLSSLIAGGLAGMSVDVALFPLDTVKTRLQSSQGFVAAGGWRGVYK